MTAYRKRPSERNKRVTTSISISTDLLQALDRIAYEHEKSRCAVIRDALLRHVRADRMHLKRDRKSQQE